MIEKNIVLTPQLPQKAGNQSQEVKNKKSVSEKKKEKRIMRLAGKAVAEFSMI